MKTGFMLMEEDQTPLYKQLVEKAKDMPVGTELPFEKINKMVGRDVRLQPKSL